MHNSDNFLGPTDPILAADEAWGIDLEGEVAVITGDVPYGCTADDAARHIKLVMLVNDVSLLNLILPAAERWFVATYNEALPLVKDPKLAEDMRGFIGQEGGEELRLHQTKSCQTIGIWPPDRRFEQQELVKRPS